MNASKQKTYLIFWRKYHLSKLEEKENKKILRLAKFLEQLMI